MSDLVIVDADQGWDGLLASAPAAHPAVPVIALLGSEAPGRIAWALEQGAGAIIAKPVASSAVYPALVMAVSIHQERMATRSKMDRLEERVRMRPLVHAAVQKIMEARGVGEEQAYTILRGSAMQRRLPMEQLAAFILGGSEPAGGRLMRVLKSMFRQPSALFGLIIVIAVVVMAIAAPLLAPFSPDDQMFDGLSLDGAPLPPGGPYLLGTDTLGRDLFSRLLFGARTSLVIGLVANGIAVAIGLFIGIVAGYVGASSAIC